MWMEVEQGGELWFTGRLVTMHFLGAYRHVVDPKNRLAIPSAFRKELAAPDGKTKLVARPIVSDRDGITRRYVELLTVGEFDTASDCAGMEKKLNLSESEMDLINRTYADAATLEMDLQGRVLIPECFMARPENTDDPFGTRLLGTDVFVVGSRTRIQIWNAQEYIEYRRRTGGRRGTAPVPAGGPGA